MTSAAHQVRDISQAIEAVEAVPAMIWWADAEGRSTYFNRAWLEFTGRSLEDEVGWGWIAGVHAEDRIRCRTEREAARQERRELRLDYRLERYDGEHRWLVDQAVPVYSADGEFRGFVGHCVDVTARKLLAARLEQASDQLAVLVEALPDAVVLKDAAGRWQLANSAARALLGLGTDWQGRSDTELASLLPRSSAGLLSLQSGDERAWTAGRRHDSVDLVPGPDGLPRYLEVSRVPLYAGGERRSLVILGRNAAERRLGENALLLAASVFDHNPEGIMITDASSRIVRVNRAFCEITGYAPEEVLGRQPGILSSGRHDAAFYAAMWQAVSRAGRWSGEIWNRRKSGEVYPEWLSIVAVPDASGQVSHYLGTFADIAKQKDVEAEVRRLAYCDPLTGLGNRRFLEERLDLECAAAAAEGCSLAILVVDLDRFGAVNHAVGYPAGDAVIQSVGGRLAQANAPGGLLARWYGEQFVLVLKEGTASIGGHAARTSALICQDLARPYLVDHREIRLTASIGIALFPRDAGTPGDLVRCAESALRGAKAAGRNGTRFYSSSADVEARERHALEQDLQHAVARAQLSLHYQPQVDAVTGVVSGAEALLRWQHPERGWIPATEFVALAEETDLILTLGAFALERCCAQIAQWRGSGLALDRVAVNIASRQLHQPGFAASVKAALARHGVPPHALDLEMTESALIQSGAAQALAELRQIGVRVALDDFGTGYSSLNYLKRLPIDILKIDRSFVSGIPADATDVAIAGAICTMAGSLGLRVIAEGVETMEQARLLGSIGVAELQGFFASPALEPEAFARFVREGDKIRLELAS